MPSPPHLVGRIVELRRGGLLLLILGAVGVLIACLAMAGPRVAGLLASSALVAVPAAVIAVGLGGAMAVLLAKTDVPGQRLALAVLIALTLLPLTVFAAGWLAALGEGGWLPAWFAGDRPTRGWLAGYPGAIGLHALAATPLATLLACAAFRAIDRRREEQARLDASDAQVLIRVSLRDTGPRLAAAATALAVLIATEMTITDLLQLRTFAEEVYTQAAAGQLSAAVGGARSMWFGVLVMASLVAMAVLLGAAAGSGSIGNQGGPPWRLALRRPRLAQSALLVAIGLLAAPPIGSMVRSAGMLSLTDESPVRRVWSAEKAVRSVAIAPWQHRRELLVSLTLAASVATGATLAGAIVAWAIRTRPLLRGVAVVLGVMLIATPGPVVGVTVIRLLNQPLDSPLWWLGELYGTWFAPWLAQVFRIAPYAGLLLAPAALAFPAGLIDAARSDGAGAWTRATRIAAPLVWPALLAVWLVAFAFSLGELSATVLTVPPGTPPISVRLLSLLHYGVEDRVAAISLVLVAGYGAVALAVLRLLPLTRRLG